VNAGSGNDGVDLAPIALPATVFGGDGADSITGGAGDDQLYGSAGDDALVGSLGNDRLDGGAGSDDMSGGPGTDTVNYGTRTKGLYVNLENNLADDGEAGEKDNARGSIEIVSGGAGNDTIIGTSDANIFYGNGGDDQLYGRGGNDILVGGSGHNRLSGEDGNDTLYARNGLSDVLDGGLGSDKARRDVIDSVKYVEKFI